jgi:hypothetical protein
MKRKWFNRRIPPKRLGLFRAYKNCTKCGYRESIWDVLYISDTIMLCKKCAKED